MRSHSQNALSGRPGEDQAVLDLARSLWGLWSEEVAPPPEVAPQGLTVAHLRPSRDYPRKSLCNTRLCQAKPSKQSQEGECGRNWRNIAVKARIAGSRLSPEIGLTHLYGLFFAHDNKSDRLRVFVLKEKTSSWIQPGPFLALCAQTETPHSTLA